MNQAPARVTADTASTIDLEKLRATPLATAPYPHVIVPGFVREEVFERILADYPAIRKSGSFSLSTLSYGGAFSQLLEDLRGDEFRAAVEQKFAVDLRNRPTMVSVRGKCGLRDGRIHTDTESKILSLLLYMNRSWEENEGGRLRILRSRNLDDVAAEVPPSGGTLLIFKRTGNSFHGHKRFVGSRKVVQVNWITEQKYADRNDARHFWSSLVKKLNPFG